MVGGGTPAGTPPLAFELTMPMLECREHGAAKEQAF
jgi:hypothetical protein